MYSTQESLIASSDPTPKEAVQYYTVSGVRIIVRRMLRDVQQDWRPQKRAHVS